MNSAKLSLGRAEVEDLLFSFSPRAYVEAIEARSLFPWQADVLEDPAHFICIDGARQGGKSTIVAKPAAHSAHFFPGSLTVILAATEKQAQEDMRKVKAFIAFDHDYPAIVRSSDSLLELANGSRIIVVTATEDSARGFSQYDQGPRLIILDEASRIDEIVFASGVLPMLTDNKDAVLLVISTPRGRKGFFWEAMQDKTFSRYHIRAPWDVIDTEWRLVPAAPEEQFRKDCAKKGIKGYYSPRDRWIEQQQFFLRKLGPLLYRQEKLGEFVEPMDQVFSYDEIDRMFNREDKPEALAMGKIPASGELTRLEFRDVDD
jgi:hypothetical protein